ncbi:hypothetical protein R8O08_00105, partial [Escherichia coli]|uniref:hypothetical protein n=1 Tax=Escherichia coli TaxID=562 RepID=UPI0029661048
MYVPLKTPSAAFWRKKRKKTRKHQAKPEKRARIVFRGLHNYARKRCAIDFDCSEGRTGQNDKFSRPGWKVLHGDFLFQSFTFRQDKKNRPGVGARIRVCEKFFLVVECVNVRN